MIKVNRVKKIRKIKKKGSTFIIVVFVTAILFTTATTMIAVVTNDYKTRVNESKKLENLYQSDAKLDLAYNLIVKNADKAVVYANNKIAQDYNTKIIDPNVDSYDVINGKFKQYFFEFLNGTTTNLSGYSETSLPDETAILAYGILSSQYKEIPSAISMNPTVDALANINSYKFVPDKDLDTSEKTRQDGTLEITDYNYTDDSSNHNSNSKIVIGLKSTFKTDTTESKTSLDNKKVITTKYTVTAPDYNQPVINKSKVVPGTTYAVEKAITADGNLKADGATININGDAWIKGDYNNIDGADNVAYKKYEQGIWLDQSEFNITGVLATNNTLTLSNASKAKIDSDLYAMNAYIGPLKSKAVEKEAGGNSLLANNIYTNNDLVMNSSNGSTIEASNYYGISDQKESTVFNRASKSDMAKASSSIIVNEHENSTVKIKNDAYIAGLAYMDTKDVAYTTGESIGVRGNYVAYEDKLSGEENVEIKQYEPYSLIESVDQKIPGYQVKANHFEQYYSANSNTPNDFSNGGISIGSVYSIGAGVNKDGIVSAKTSGEELADITEVQNLGKEKYGQYVYGMGHLADGKTAMDYYQDYQTNPKAENMRTVKGEINFNEINTSNVNLKNLYTQKDFKDGNKENDGYLLLSADEDSTITIDGTQVVLTDKDGKELQRIDNAKSNDDVESVKAVIITKGNVVFKGDVNYIGTVIAGGDVTFNEGSKVNITYNAKTISSVIAYNKEGNVDDSLQLFNGKPISVEEDTTVQNIVNVPNDKIEIKPANNQYAAQDGWYDTSKIKKGLWKLQKETGEVIEQK